MTEIHDIGQRFQQLVDQSLPGNKPWVSVSLPLTGVSNHSLPDIIDERYFWMRPDKGMHWLGLGSAWRLEKRGDLHLTGLAEEAERFCSQIKLIDPEACARSPRLSLISENGSGCLNLPVVQFNSCNGATVVTVTPDPSHPKQWVDILEHSLAAIAQATEPLPGPPLLTLQEQQPEADLWMKLSERAVQDLSAGHLKKLVLARRIRLKAQRSLSPRHLLRSLACQHSHCTIFAADRNDGCWVGASPEVLLDLGERRFFCEAVAGTVRRDPYESVDRELGEWLLRDPKNRSEHDLVVGALYGVLRPMSRTLEVDDQPRLLRLQGLQHLYTPISGELKKNEHPLRIAQELHPSPAVCGAPKQDARTWLHQHEPLDRRWFSGLTGWIDIDGDASLNVVLRCANLQKNRVDLYAGAGLMPDSDSLAEWEETELKLANMTKALQDA